MAKTVFRPFEIVSLQSTMVLKHEGQEGGQDVQAVEEAGEVRSTRAHRRRPAPRGRGLQGAVGQGEGSAHRLGQGRGGPYSQGGRERRLRGGQAQDQPGPEAQAGGGGRGDQDRGRGREKGGRAPGAAPSRASKRPSARPSKKGREEGREEGYKEGVAEAERLVGRLHVILDRAMDKRAEILAGDRGAGHRARPPRRQEGRQGHLREPEERRHPEYHAGPAQAQDQERRHRAG